MLGIAWGAGAGYDDNHDDMGGDKHHHHHDGDHHGHRPGAQPFSGFAVNCPDICVATTGAICRPYRFSPNEHNLPGPRNPHTQNRKRRAANLHPFAGRDWAARLCWVTRLGLEE